MYVSSLDLGKHCTTLHKGILHAACGYCSTSADARIVYITVYNYLRTVATRLIDFLPRISYGYTPRAVPGSGVGLLGGKLTFGGSPG
jgi:hypothetical protein